MAELVHVKGLAELQKFLDQLPAKIEANIMRGALRAGMRPIRDAARAGIRNVSGDLARSLRIGSNRRGGTVTASLRTRDFIARFVEYGTEPHWIKVKESASRAVVLGRRSRTVGIGSLNRMAKRGSLVIGGHFIGASVEHPGARPRPFLRPALDTQAQAALMAAGEYIKHRLATKHGLDTADINITSGDEP